MTKRMILLIYTTLHFLVDFACIYFMAARMIPRAGSQEEWLFWAVLYNLMAFALPMVMGMLADILDCNLLLSAAGCLGVLLGYLLYSRPVAAVVFLGIGNGLFHIGGGRQIMEDSEGRYGPSGIFISTGTLGVYLGMLIGKKFIPAWNQIFAAVFVGMLLLGWLYRKYGRGRADAAAAQAGGGVQASLAAGAKEAEQPGAGAEAAAVAALLAVVCIRSYYGMITNYSWKGTVLMGLIFTLCVLGGKLTGGLLADRFGVRRITALSLGMAGVLALFSFSSPVCGCLSIYFFNMTMPLTLMRMGKHFPSGQGFAFGVLMLALFLGTVPTMAWQVSWLFSPAGLLGLCIISMLLMLWETGAWKKCG